MGSTQSTPFQVIGGVTTTTNLPSYTTHYQVPVTPTPPQLACAARGTLSKPDMFQNFTVTPDNLFNTKNFTFFDYCQDNCRHDNDYCTSFSFDFANKRCSLYSKSLYNMGFKVDEDSTNTEKFYNKRCFKNATSVIHPVETLYLYRPPAQTGLLTNPNKTYDSQVEFHGWLVSWFWTVHLPFEMEFYGVKTSTVNVSKNGILGLEGTGNYIQSYHQPLPAYNLAEHTSIMPYWSEISTVAGTNQTVHYTIRGTSPNRILIFSWVVTDTKTHAQSYSFSVAYDESRPGTVSMYYDDVSDEGLHATIGAQTTRDGKKFSQYLYNNVTRSKKMPNRITAGTVLVWDREKEKFYKRVDEPAGPSPPSSLRVKPSAPEVYSTRLA